MCKKLLQLIKDNINRTEPGIIVLNADSDEVTMYLYDVIDEYWGISAADFNKELIAHTGKTVHLRINSPGGDVFAAEAMATMIKQHGNVIAHIDGYAASAATRIASAAKTVEISEQGFYMIHNAWTFAYGNKNELRDTADLLSKVDDTIIADYAKKTGNTREQIIAWMDAETWFNAQEALDNGFVNSIFTGETDNTDKAVTDKAKNWNLSAFENAPKALTERDAPEKTITDLIKNNTDANQRRLRLLELT
jgi:ATP-dependent Clp protease protease subunit